MDMIETIRYTESVKAVKAHKCSYCGEEIKAGTTYLKSTHKLDGDIYDWKSHPYCNKLVSLLKMEANDEGGYDEENFQESVSQEFFELLTKELSTEERSKLKIILQYLHNVRWRDKLWFVLRHYNKLENGTLLKPLTP